MLTQLPVRTTAYSHNCACSHNCLLAQLPTHTTACSHICLLAQLRARTSAYSHNCSARTTALLAQLRARTTAYSHNCVLAQMPARTTAACSHTTTCSHTHTCMLTHMHDNNVMCCILGKTNKIPLLRFSPITENGTSSHTCKLHHFKGNFFSLKNIYWKLLYRD